MSEDFLHYIWKFRLFNASELLTTNGEPVEVILPGDHNQDAGPDFFNARVRIAGTLWAGNVEVHLNASDWARHNHQFDKRYDNIILHVVFRNDAPLRRPDGAHVPTIELQGRVRRAMMERYHVFRESASWIPCARQLESVPELVTASVLDRLVAERLAEKSAAVESLLRSTGGDWEEAFYQALARNFGFRTNSDPFSLLARSLPLRIISRQRTSLLEVEALLFGQAGMLETVHEEPYPRALQNAYVPLQRKYRLSPMPAHLWKYLRLRPGNFPEIRLAQFAALMYRHERLFATIRESGPGQALGLFSASVSTYWQSHYSFGRESERIEKRIGVSSAENIMINTVIPFLFYYGKVHGDEARCQAAAELLSELTPESNAVILKWKMHGIVARSASDSQALLQLKSHYCQKKNCLRCGIGNYLLKNS